MALEDYAERVGMQVWLDETFPEGAGFVMVEYMEDRMSPGLNAVTGRLFCSGARLGPDGWEYQIFAEPIVVEEGDPIGESDTPVWSPLEVWVPGLFPVDGIEGLFEGPVIGDDRDSSARSGFRALRKVLPERIRDEQTARLEAGFFPSGFEVS